MSSWITSFAGFECCILTRHFHSCSFLARSSLLICAVCTHRPSRKILSHCQSCSLMTSIIQEARRTAKHLGSGRRHNSLRPRQASRLDGQYRRRRFATNCQRGSIATFLFVIVMLRKASLFQARWSDKNRRPPMLT